MALDLIEELEGLVDALAAAGIDYALCGGLALGVLGYPRMTKDIDLLVRPEDVPRIDVPSAPRRDRPCGGTERRRWSFDTQAAPTVSTWH